MTNATVKPTLSRIEQKLDTLTNLMNKENSGKDDKQENEGQIIEKGQVTKIEDEQKVDCLNDECKEELTQNAS